MAVSKSVGILTSCSSSDTLRVMDEAIHAGFFSAFTFGNHDPDTKLVSWLLIVQSSHPLPNKLSTLL